MSSESRDRIGFRRVLSAAVDYHLETEDFWEVCIYPSEAGRGWDAFAEEDESICTLRRAVIPDPRRDVTVILGPPSTGKTVQLLLLGHLWEMQSTSPSHSHFRLRRSKPKRRAFYGRAAQLDLDSCLRLVENQEENECLWLIDEVHGALDTTIEFIREFRRLELRGGNHALVVAFTGWSLPKELRRGNIAIQKLQLTPETISSALSARRIPVPSQEVLQNLAHLPAIGLRQILRYPQWLTEPARLQTAFIEELEDRLPGSARHVLLELLGQLARSRFLGVPFGPVAHKDTMAHLTTLHQLGLATLSMITYQAALPDDELARILLVKEFSAVASDNLVPRFLAPLRDSIERCLNQGVSGFPCVMLAGLSARSTQEFYEWVGLPPSEGQSSLFAALLQDQDFVARLTSVLKRENTPIEDVARIVMVSGWEEESRKEIAQAVLDTRLDDLDASLPSADMPLWQATATLARIAGDDRLKRSLTCALSNERLAASVAFYLSHTAFRRSLLSALEWVDCQEAVRVLRSQLPTKSHGIWKSLHRLNKSNPSLAFRVLMELPPAQVAIAALQSPRLAHRVYSHRVTPSQHLQVKAAFLRALLGQRVEKQHVTHWKEPYDLSALLSFARHLELPTLLEGETVQEIAYRVLNSLPLARVVSSWFYHEIRMCEQPASLKESLEIRLEQMILASAESSPARIRALILLNRPRATPFVVRMLESLEAIPPDLNRCFRALWNAAVFLPQEQQDSLQEKAKHLMARWEALTQDSHCFTRLALSGLCGFILNEPPPVSPMGEEPVPGQKPNSPSLSACQLYALAGWELDSSSGIFKYLEWVVNGVASPSRDFLMEWSSLPGVEKKTIRRMISQSAAVLRSGIGTYQLATRLNNSRALRELRQMEHPSSPVESQEVVSAGRSGPPKYQVRRERMEEDLPRWRGTLAKNESRISRIEEDIDKCEQMANNAKSADFAEQIRGWISEKYQKIEDIRRTSTELEEKIRDVETRFG